MMKKLLLAGASFAALVAGPATAAADSAAPVYRRPVAMVAPWTWSGFYLGVQGGAGWGASDGNATSSSAVDSEGFSSAIPLGSASYPLNGWHGGGTIGYNWQIGQTVLGVEGDISGSKIDGRGDCTNAVGTLFVVRGTSSCDTNMTWFATQTARLGFAVDHALWYVKGGVAEAHFNHDITSSVVGVGLARALVAFGGFSGAAASLSETRTGGTFGVGVE
jgi:outer membrane immunogenic protein